MDCPFPGVEFFHGATRMIQIGCAGIRKPHHTTGTIQQLHAQQFFQMLDLLR